MSAAGGEGAGASSSPQAPGAAGLLIPRHLQTGGLLNPTHIADCSPENLFSDIPAVTPAKALGMPGNQGWVGSGKRGQEAPGN